MSPFFRWTYSKSITLRTEQGPDCHLSLSRYPYTANKVHKHLNAWAPLVPLSKNMLRAIMPLASIWLNFWAVAPAASQFFGECFYSAESDSQPYSLRKEILSALRTDCFILTQVKKLSNLLLCLKKVSQKLEFSVRTTMSTFPCHRQNCMERHIIIRKKGPIK